MFQIAHLTRSIFSVWLNPQKCRQIFKQLLSHTYAIARHGSKVQRILRNVGGDQGATKLGQKCNQKWSQNDLVRLSLSKHRVGYCCLIMYLCFGGNYYPNLTIKRRESRCILIISALLQYSTILDKNWVIFITVRQGKGKRLYFPCGNLD